MRYKVVDFRVLDDKAHMLTTQERLNAMRAAQLVLDEGGPLDYADYAAWRCTVWHWLEPTQATEIVVIDENGDFVDLYPDED